MSRVKRAWQLLNCILQEAPRGVSVSAREHEQCCATHTKVQKGTKRYKKVHVLVVFVMCGTLEVWCCSCAPDGIRYDRKQVGVICSIRCVSTVRIMNGSPRGGDICLPYGQGSDWLRRGCSRGDDRFDARKQAPRLVGFLCRSCSPFFN